MVWECVCQELNPDNSNECKSCNLSKELGATSQVNEKTIELSQAIQQGDTEKAKKLIDSGADYNEKDVEGYDALLRAVAKGNIELLEYLVAKGVSPATSETKDGRTALMIAAEHQQPEMIPILVKLGCNPNQKRTRSGTSVLKLALEQVRSKNPRVASNESTHSRVIENLINCGAVIDDGEQK